MAYFLPLLVAHGIYTGIITGIGGITMGACSSIKKIYTHQNPNVTKIMKRLDLERRLVLIQSVLNVIDEHSVDKIAEKKLDELEKTQIFEMVGASNKAWDPTCHFVDKVDMEININKDPIELCLIFLHQTIQDIHNDLSDVNKKVSRHNTKWFSSWRTLDIKNMLDRLDYHSAQLDGRFDDLTRISLFLKNRK